MNDVRIGFGQPLPVGGLLEDAEFLQSVAWGRQAPPALVRAARQGDVAAAGRRLRQRLRGASADERGALWSRQGLAERPETAGLIELVGGLDRQPARTGQRLRQWLDRQADAGACLPLELLILFDLLGRRDLADDLFWPVWRAALGTAAALGTSQHEAEAAGATDDQRLVVLGELPWRAGVIFADVQGADRLRRAGQRVLRRQLLNQTDTDGMVRAERLERAAFWLAPLIRAAATARQAKIELWDDVCRPRFRALMKMVSPLCVGEGRLALSNGFAGQRGPMLRVGLRLAGWTPRHAPMRALRQMDRRPAARGTVRPVRSEFLPAMQSDWARLGCLRSGWSPEADTLVVAHHGPRPEIELSAFGRTLLGGVWDLDVALDGRPLDITGEWSCICWNSDGDADYLELQLRLPGNLRIERQLLLSRTDHFAVLADAVSGARGRRIDYRSQVPVATNHAIDADVPTRECRLIGPDLTARVFPLALPWDRVHSTAGSLCGSPRSALELRQTSVGGLYAPLVIDWHPERRKANADWRTLTITEDRRLLKSDAAAGHRLRLGTRQWLIYRALIHTRESRAVLGHHTPHETVIARFDTTGTVTPILLVE